MRTFDELVAALEAAPQPPRERGTVRLICVRKGDGAHDCPPQVNLTVDGGVEGDRWARGESPDREAQVTLINAWVAEQIASDHAPLHEAGDNFVVELDVGEAALPAGTRLRLGTALLEITALPHTGCKKFRARFGLDALKWAAHPSNAGRRLRGVHGRVIEAGEVRVGDTVAVERGER